MPPQQTAQQEATESGGGGAAAFHAEDSSVPVVNRMDTTAQYTDEDMRRAMESIYHSGGGSADDHRDCRHIFGYGREKQHELSMLQKVTACVWLDYERYRSSSSEGAAPAVDELERQAAEFRQLHGPTLDLRRVIQSQAPRMALAAEFKRASPSKGDIAVYLNAGEQAVKYSQAGASVISCLTEQRWFKGSLRDMTEVRLATAAAAAAASGQRPAVLRKEFVTTEYAVVEAAAGGADSVLLIVAVLPESLLRRLIDCSRRLGMEPLVEVHADAELDVALAAGARVIGVNNRNLHTFQVDLSTSERVADRLAAQGVSFRHGECSDDENSVALCALSGMSTCHDVDRFRRAGLGMCLIGEALMRSSDPRAAIEGLRLDPDDYACQQQQQRTGGPSRGAGGAYTGGTRVVKVCGITSVEDALAACRAGAHLIGVIFAERSKRRVGTERASAVAAAVRQFGERGARTEFPRPSAEEEDAPLPHLTRSAQVLAQATKQRPAVVGVFQNQSADFIRRTVEECGLDLVQLHGHEGMEAANRDVLGVPAIRVVDIAVDPETGETVADAVERLLDSVTNDPAAILLDTSIKGGAAGGGGTGVAFDWAIAERLQAAGLPVIVAGGLNPENVKDCVGRIGPFGVDVSSGVEKEPGLKDHGRVQEFVQGARDAAVEASKGF